MGDSGYWVTSDRFYSYDDRTFTKRELRLSEQKFNWKREIIKAPWTRERLQNEFKALEFIAAKTTIPVPKVLRFEQVWGAYQLVMERVNGKPLDRIKDNRAEALLNAEDFINTTVLPQLRSLKSCSIGALIGVVIPPVRITTRDKRGTWPAKVANTPLFSFCHNDLAQHNVLINEDTLQVEAIIDWELSGYYPSEFEAPLWTIAWNEPGYHDIEADKIEDLIYFLSDTSKQKRPRRESCTNFYQTPCQSSQTFQDTKRMDRPETLAHTQTSLWTPNDISAFFVSQFLETGKGDI